MSKSSNNYEHNNLGINWQSRVDHVVHSIIQSAKALIAERGNASTWHRAIIRDVARSYPD